MKGKILYSGLVPATVALISIWAILAISGCGDIEQAYEERLLTVLNPAISSKMAERVPLVPRMDTVEGKTIYMVDLQWGGPKAAYSVFEEIQGWFSRNMPSVKTEIRRSSGGPFGDDEELRKEIMAKKVDGVIVGIGG